MLSAKLKELWFKYKNWEYCPTHCVRMVEYVPTYDVRAGHTLQGACPICYPELVGRAAKMCDAAARRVPDDLRLTLLMRSIEDRVLL
jgi:hypothetical protein